MMREARSAYGVLRLAALALLAGAAPVAAQTVVGPPSSSSTVAPPWHNPDGDPAPPSAAVPPPPPSAAPSPPPRPLGTVSPIHGGALRPECREFRQTITISGQPVQAYGTACRQPDGIWKIVR
jgi:hypothetical protein